MGTQKCSLTEFSQRQGLIFNKTLTPKKKKANRERNEKEKKKKRIKETPAFSFVSVSSLLVQR